MTAPLAKSAPGREEREHILREDCWCNPVVESYGMAQDDGETG